MGQGRGIPGWPLSLGALLTVAMLTVALAAGSSVAQTEPIPDVDCASRIQVSGDSSPGPKSVAVGPVVFNGLKMWKTAPRAWFRQQGDRWGAVKFPFFVEAGGAPVTATLAEQHRGLALVDVGLDAGGAAKGMAVRIEPCPAGHKGKRWTVFLAGFKVKAPTCLRVSVQVEGEPAPIGPRKVAIGKHSCRGK